VGKFFWSKPQKAQDRETPVIPTDDFIRNDGIRNSDGHGSHWQEPNHK